MIEVVNIDNPTVTQVSTKDWSAAIIATPKLNVLPDNNPKSAFGTKKPAMHLIPQTMLVVLSRVMMLGAKKYGAYNWRTNSVAASVYVGAAMRHLASWWDGEDNDPETGVTHLGSVVACCAILIDAWATGNLIDDRPPTGAAARLIGELTIA